jgi:hypothetical protein
VDYRQLEKLLEPVKVSVTMRERLVKGRSELRSG